MPVYNMYRKNKIQPMREYIPGEDLSDISVWEGDDPEEGGMIAINPKNTEDKWFINKIFFEENYVLDNDDIYYEGPIVIGEMDSEGAIDLGIHDFGEKNNG